MRTRVEADNIRSLRRQSHRRGEHPRHIEARNMRVLVLYAHPTEESYQSALHRRAVAALTGAGHEVDDCDLYSEDFPAVLTPSERRDYHDVGINRSFAPKHIERLLSCQGLVFIFPTWWYGIPAILKGYFDRVWLPGVAFDVSGPKTTPLLTHIERLSVVTTYGSPWWLNNLYVGNLNRRLFKRGIRRLLSPSARTTWLALYGMDYVSDAKRKSFLDRVDRAMRSI
jgi:NAD(P)H dehydrogenase (quinone)